MEVTFETEETVVLRDGPQTSIVYCDECGQSVLMATPYAAAFVSGFTERDLFRLLENGHIHFVELSRLLVCLRSLDRVRGI